MPILQRVDLQTLTIVYVTGESQNIQQLEPFEGPNQIFIDNGQGLQIHSLENWHSTMQLEYETLIKNHT